MELKELKMVLAIAKHGSLVRAVRVLGTSQPALARALGALEARLRGPLFDRNRHGVIVTDLGRALLSDAQDLIDRLSRLKQYAASVRGDQVRETSIVAGAFVAESVWMAAGRGPRGRVRAQPVAARATDPAERDGL